MMSAIGTWRDTPGMQHKRDMKQENTSLINACYQIPKLEAAGSNPAGVTTRRFLRRLKRMRS